MEVSMNIDLNALSYDELQALSRDVTKAISGYEKRKKQEALNEMRMIAEKHGFSLSDIVSGGDKSKAKKGQPKYMNPDEPKETWTGRGRKPGWVIKALGVGKSLEEMVILNPFHNRISWSTTRCSSVQRRFCETPLEFALNSSKGRN